MSSAGQTSTCTLDDLRIAARYFAAAEALLEFSKTTSLLPPPTSAPAAPPPCVPAKRPAKSASVRTAQRGSAKTRAMRATNCELTRKVQRARARAALKARAAAIRSVANRPATPWQVDIQMDVYRYITPYPTEPWLDIVGIAVGRTRPQVKHWFSNQRQKDVAAARKAAGERGKQALYADLRDAEVDGRRLRLRPGAIAGVCATVAWTDDVFQQAVDAFVKIRQ
ncbi:hypothetical protein B0H21DRAFT_493365 [Amylocystis lapponica]|nr:hypothetical protein B0H21DRAFT_493365 [Amylocystis lapponica]